MNLRLGKLILALSISVHFELNSINIIIIFTGYNLLLIKKNFKTVHKNSCKSQTYKSGHLTYTTQIYISLKGENKTTCASKPSV